MVDFAPKMHSVAEFQSGHQTSLNSPFDELLLLQLQLHQLQMRTQHSVEPVAGSAYFACEGVFSSQHYLSNLKLYRPLVALISLIAALGRFVHIVASDRAVDVALASGLSSYAALTCCIFPEYFAASIAQSVAAAVVYSDSAADHHYSHLREE